jgi:hypothetical protein
VIEVEPAPDTASTAAPAASPHGLDPVAALAHAWAWGDPASPVFLVACEPQVLSGDEGVMGLSPPVAAAITAVQALVRRLQTET